MNIDFFLEALSQRLERIFFPVQQINQPSLPPELINQIFKNLDPQSLVRCSRVSVQFYVCTREREFLLKILFAKNKAAENQIAAASNRAMAFTEVRSRYKVMTKRD